jgi:hypothetical protein
LYLIHVNPLEATSLARHKNAFAAAMQKCKLPCPVTLLMIPRDASEADKRRLTERFMGLFEALDVTELFLKPENGIRSIGAFKARLRDGRLHIEGTEVEARNFFDFLFSNPRHACYIAQAVIPQHHAIDRINSSCLNPVRIDTFIVGEQVLHSLALLFVGNGFATAYGSREGRVMVKIDLITGELSGSGIMLTTNTLGSQHEVVHAHPVTGVAFGGVMVPFWKEIKQLVHDAALVMRPLRAIGWDVVVTPVGPLLLEANDDQELFIIQTAVGGLARTPLGRHIMKRADEWRIGERLVWQ